ncbi:phytanoyl-CoA dioxygenase family protein [Paenibacillus lycopersici]|uniref:Phytanoyl-CoA dioxygenase family protein n=1 Tax=Paenibacillus lycopersici TaxID=2704462 RepID=A0A6C0G6H9_9BACL|nr:phytanoyl-CoA dioxygenase family protein [Paenibacillus lycopersici]QHT63150.1 phytanoyl-CoA dioxygenase family protein [Paenibacillus lycopersici]
MTSQAGFTLTDAQKTQYAENGYLIVNQLFTTAECDELIQNANAMITGAIPLGAHNGIYLEPEAVAQGLVSDERPDPEYLFKLGHRMHMTDEIFRYYAMHDNIADILAGLLGPDIKCIQSMYIDKPRNLGVGQPYHQDSYYLKSEPDTLIGVWIALDDVDEQNGCLHVIPGSHRGPIYPHELPHDERQRKYFTEVHAAKKEAEVACRLPKGSAVFFPGTMLHRSGDNVAADRQRRAYVLHYLNARSKQPNQAQSRNPHLLVRGRQYPGCV